MVLPDGTTQALGPAVRDAFAISKGLCLLGNGERPQLLQLEYFHRRLLSSQSKAYSRTTMNSLVRCVSLPVCPSATCVPAVVLKSLSGARHSELLVLLQHHSYPAPQNALRSPLSRFRSAALVSSSSCSCNSLQARDGGRSHLHTAHQTHWRRDRFR